MTKHLLVIIMNLLTIGAIVGAVVGCSEQDNIDRSMERRIELTENYLNDHGWIKDYNYDYCTFDQSTPAVGDEYFQIRIYTNDKPYPTVIDCVYYE